MSHAFVKASAKRLRQFQERDLSGLDLVALFLDGKNFAEDEMGIALDVSLDGSNHVLEFVQMDTENERPSANSWSGCSTVVWTSAKGSWP